MKLLFTITLLLLVGANALIETASTSGGVTESKMRFRCRVAYDGTHFCGFQLQGSEKKKEQRTIQGTLEAVLHQRFQRPIRVVGAGRTDAGVHSRGQAIHFDLFENETIAVSTTSRNDDDGSDESRCRETPQLQSFMNAMLTPDIRVWNVQRAPMRTEEIVNGRTSVHEWNVMRKCNAKLYSYRLCTGDYMDPMGRHGRWQLDWGNEIDTVFLGQILKRFEGSHDFKCFAGALEQNERKTGKKMGTIRTIRSVELVKERQPDQYRIDIHLEGALYKMVRNMVGTSLDVCRGRLTEKQFEELLHPTEDMSRASNKSKPAPPEGLSLEHVFYPDDDDF